MLRAIEHDRIICEGRCEYDVGGLFDFLIDIPNDECVVSSIALQLVAFYTSVLKPPISEQS